MHPTLRKIIAIQLKNFKRSLSNKKKLLSHFFVPVLICLLYYAYQNALVSKQGLTPDINNPDTISQLTFATIIVTILKTLLTIQIGLINGSTLRQTITLFINEREEEHRQYQFVMGLCKRWHTLSNMLYMMFMESIYLFPFWLILNYYQFKIVYVFNFAAFIVSTNFLTIALTSFFSEHKVATQVIGIIFSMTSFLALIYKPQIHDYKYYLATFLPNSAFAIALFEQDQYQSFRTSLSSLVMWKVYLIVFYTVQFRSDFLQTFRRCKIKCQNILRPNPQNENILINQQIQSSSVLSKQQSQDDNLRLGAITIEMTNIEKSFGKVHALNGINLKVRKAEILGLLGRNGAGKTTLVDIITKVTRPSSGLIKFNKNKVDGKEVDIRMGICYQHQILYQDLTAIDHLKFYSQIKSIQNPQQQIQKIVQKVGIVQQLPKKVKELSGGNKRKLSFCLALLNSPDLLIFDEPTSGLDPASRRNIWEILQQLRSGDRSIILTTHHLDEADFLSDRICIIKKGKIIEQGTPAQIKQRHGKGYYLTVYQSQANNGEQGQYKLRAPFDQKLYTKILGEYLKQIKIIDKNKDSIKYFISQNNPYQMLIKCIEMLQRIENVCVGLETNNLEQSFIAINMDSDINNQFGYQQNNSNLQQIQLNQQLDPAIRQNPSSLTSQQLQLSNPSAQYSAINQLYAVLLKNFYCFVHKYHYFYNMNLIILVFVTLVNTIFIERLSQKVDLGISEQQKKEQSKANPLFLLQGYILMSSAFLAIPVYEKEEKIDKLLKTRGVRTINYWVGHFIFDYGYFWLNFIILRIWFAEIITLIPIWIIACTGIAMIFYVYTCSLIFNKVKTANAWFTIINTLLWLAQMPLLLSDQMLSNSFYRHLKFMKYLSPYFDMNYYLLKNLQVVQQVKQAEKLFTQQEQTYTVHICLIIYLCIFIIIKSKVLIALWKREQDEEIIEQIKLQNINKKYKDIEALKNVSYKIDNQSIALLGHNGAGKSTTFGLLSSQLNPTSGRVYLEKSYKKYTQEMLYQTGICYQQDTLWKFMSPSKIMKIFMYIVGVKDKQKQQDWLYDNLDIETQLKNRKFDNLSGGNKRKICMAVCLIGSPKIKLLDQCSTGLDPVSRLSMVNTLKKQNIGGGSTVFTTHSIPEAEQICQRAIIMKKGEVSEDNKIYKLKQKYYPYYWVQLALSPSQQKQRLKSKESQSQSGESNAIIQKVQSLFGQDLKALDYSIKKVRKGQNIIQIKKHALKLSELMKKLTTSKNKKIIWDFSIDEPKLEDVYLLLTRQEGEQEEQGSGNRLNNIGSMQNANSVVFVDTNVNGRPMEMQMRQV